MLKCIRPYTKELAVLLIVFALIVFLYSGHNSLSRIV